MYDEYDYEIPASGTSEEATDLIEICKAISTITHAKGNAKQRELMLTALEKAVESYTTCKSTHVHQYREYLNKGSIKRVK